ncbi:MAG: hypothetical protein B7Y90_05360 [Alphaproteobacteria bacterium 32-64-14]|nr:MAG: hypothetical protein B7Y90_05360 [Alphaproteobacteria bacterium 32-64-14]
MTKAKGVSPISVAFVGSDNPAPRVPLREDQKHFSQDGLALENWGVALFGYERREYFDRETGKRTTAPKSGADALNSEVRITREFYKSKDISDMKFWKNLYVRTFEVLRLSVFRSIGSIDKSHRKAIEQELDRALDRLKSANGKDAINAQVIASLFRLLFLLLGRSAYAEPGKRRDFSTFRTLTYSQTDEQLSWLLQGYIHGKAQDHGFEDHFAADFAFGAWAKLKKWPADRSTYVEWVREVFPETYAMFR